jgi:hypothetical protein
MRISEIVQQLLSTLTERGYLDNLDNLADLNHSINLHRHTALYTHRQLKLPPPKEPPLSPPPPPPQPPPTDEEPPDSGRQVSIVDFFEKLDTCGNVLFQALVLVEHLYSVSVVLKKRANQPAIKTTVLNACRKQIHELYNDFDTCFARLLCACRSNSQWVSAGMSSKDFFFEKIDEALKLVDRVQTSWNKGAIGAFVGIVSRLRELQQNKDIQGLNTLLEGSMQWIRLMRGMLSVDDELSLEMQLRAWKDNKDLDDAWSEARSFFVKSCKYHVAAAQSTTSGYKYKYLYNNSNTFVVKRENDDKNNWKHWLSAFDTTNSHRGSNKIFVQRCRVLRELGVTDNNTIKEERDKEPPDDLTQKASYANSQNAFDLVNATSRR